MRGYNIIDIETYNKNSRFVPYCICIVLDNREFSFYGDGVVEKFIEYMKKRRIREVFYAHNLTFDGSILIENIREKVNIKGILFRSNIYELKIWTEDFEIIIKCSYKMFPLSLKRVGSLMKEGCGKTEFPHDFAKEENLYFIGEHPRNKK